MSSVFQFVKNLRLIDVEERALDFQAHSKLLEFGVVRKLLNLQLGSISFAVKTWDSVCRAGQFFEGFV